MRYALNLAEDSRIFSATFAKYAGTNAVLVDNLPNGNISNYLYQDGKYVYSPVEVPALTPAEQREEVYNTTLCIEWEGETLTVTQASQKWQYYSAEGSSKANELQVLIASAKTEIRQKYPDTNQ